MSTFAELTKRVHSINDLILSDMVSVRKDYKEESVEFRDRVLVTTSWFSRISWANKKRFVLALLGDVRSVWTLSLLLKSIWNCRPKDAVLSVCQPRLLSSYDQVPMDHNRTALPLSTLKEVMTRDRQWFRSLEPEPQAVLLSELLTISGGPIMWEVLQRAEIVYQSYFEKEVQALQECNVVNEPIPEKVKTAPEPVKKETTPRKSTAGPVESGKPTFGQAQKELDANLAAWNANIKSMRDRMKLEELEMVFSDGSKKKVWKVNRPKPEAVETVDFVQLLPSEIGKKILLYLPATQLSDCARVNKYWSYLIDELKSESIARQKINIELEKLKPPKPINNLVELSERLQRRGAADENIWKWCENILSDNKHLCGEQCNTREGLVPFEYIGFPCPLMKYSFNVPLKSPLIKDPAESVTVKTIVNIAGENEQNARGKEENKRYNLWSKDMSGLYPVRKLASYQFPL